MPATKARRSRCLGSMFAWILKMNPEKPAVSGSMLRPFATRAFGPDHPGIPAVYRQAGQPVLIGGRMGTAS